MSRRTGRLRVVALLACAGVAPSALGAEMIVQGQVVDVVPLGRGPSVIERCAEPPPAEGAGLAALLRWDLDGGCRSAHRQAGAGYRVYYRWDGKTYDRVMAEPPGSTVSLRVRLR